MKYVVYQIKNIINDKVYVGIHRTHEIDDDYYGSGKLISAAIKKYGKEMFSKSIIKIFDNLDHALDLERAIVNEDFVSSKDTYNIALGGGIGGEDLNGLSFRGKRHTVDTKEKIRQARLGKSYITDEGLERIIKSNKDNEARKQKISETTKGSSKTDEHKRKIRETLLNRAPEDIPRGYKRKNKQVWINNGHASTRINIDTAIPLGWKKGRVCK
jgi:hypothetical protein